MRPPRRILAQHPALGQRLGEPTLTRVLHHAVNSRAGDGERDLKAALKGVSSVRPDRSVRQGMTAGDTALYIFTSGTTGLPKAARMTHMRVQLYMRGFAGATDSRADDVIFCALPAWRTRIDLVSATKDGSATSTAGSHRQSLRRSLVSAQVAFSFVVLISAGLLMRSFIKLA